MAITLSKSATEHLKKIFRQGNGNSFVGDRVFIHNLLSRKYFKVKHFSYPQNNAKPTYILRSILRYNIFTTIFLSRYVKEFSAEYK